MEVPICDSRSIILDSQLETGRRRCRYNNFHRSMNCDRISRIRNQVGDYLLQFSRRALERWAFSVIALNRDLLRAQFIGIKVQSGFNQASQVNGLPLLRLAVKGEGLPGDMRDSIELLFRERKILERGRWRAGDRPSKVYEIAHRI